jgi:hypothetical protein
MPATATGTKAVLALVTLNNEAPITGGTKQTGYNLKVVWADFQL